MNLLPNRQRKKIKLEILYQNIIFSGLILILLILVLVLFLGAFLVFLNFKYQDIEKKIVIEQSRVIQTETIKGMERKIRELNTDLLDLKNMQGKTSSIYQILDNISQNLLKNVEIYTIEIDGEINKVTIAGYSSTRDSLLAIKQALESSPEYKNINFPLSNLAIPKDINFQFDFIYDY